MSQADWRVLASTCRYEFPDPLIVPDEFGDLISLGADLEPSTLLYAYSHGLFPMYVDTSPQESGDKVLGWFSPAERGVFDVNNLRVTRSMIQSAKKYDVRVDTCFEDLMRMCMSVPREGGWINDDFVHAYVRMYELGFAHSVEVFHNNELVGGLYGLGFAGFAGESMVHSARDASKVALMHLTTLMREQGATLLDAQWLTPHLETLGAVGLTRERYFEQLTQSLKLSSISWC